MSGCHSEISNVGIESDNKHVEAKLYTFIVLSLGWLYRQKEKVILFRFEGKKRLKEYMVYREYVDSNGTACDQVLFKSSQFPDCCSIYSD